MTSKLWLTRLKVQAIYYCCYAIMIICIIGAWAIAFPFLLIGDWAETVVNKYRVAHQLCEIKRKTNDK